MPDRARPIRAVRHSVKERVLIQRLKNFLGYKPNDLNLYEQALIHRSAVDSNGESNERMEFLGDAVLTAIVSEILYLRFPDREEGFLTQMRSKIVKRSSLNRFAKDTHLCTWIQRQPFSNPDMTGNLAGNMLEALIGAIYLDKGYNACRKVITEQIISTLDWSTLEQRETDYKSRIIEYCQKKHIPIVFQTLTATNKDVETITPGFETTLFMNNVACSKGQGRSKKEAEQAASREAWGKNVPDLV